jgi:DNA-binding CsgD family transcriptional regulator
VEIGRKNYCGYDDLTACEIAFFMNRSGDTKKFANLAISKAVEANQGGIEAMAAQYLFRMAIKEGDCLAARELLKMEREHTGNSDFWGRQMLGNFFTSLFYAQIGARKLPEWLTADESEGQDGVRIPTRELLVGVKYYFAAKNYDQALLLLSSAADKDPRERFLFGELTISLMTAIARIMTGDAPGAVQDFERAYSLSFDGIFEMPFIERGKDLHPLIAAASVHGGCAIPKEWLKDIGRKASVYAKKMAVVLDWFKKAKKISDTIRLSKRENEVLDDLYQGLSREEIASNRYLSINTVHKTIQSIYTKLDANNMADAIRIALEKKLLD